MNQPKPGSSHEYDQTTPRLFRLRDLHPPKKVADPAATPTPAVSNDAYQVDASASPQAQARSLPQSTYQAAVYDHAAVDQAVPSSRIDETELQESSEQQMARERIERHLDASPEGRSWMESALAHRKVLVLLVIAIGAAFWTGRGDSDPSNSDPNLAIANGSLDFDSSQFDTGTLIDESKDYFAAETSKDSEPENLLADTTGPASQSNATQSAPHQNAPQMTESVTAEMNDTTNLASNSLVPDQTNDSAINDASKINDRSSTNTGSQIQPKPSPASGSVASAGEAPQPEATRSQIQAGGLTVQAVSSTTPRDPVFNAPSLNKMNNAAANAAPNQTDTELTLQDSPTPNGVADWLKYLPAYPQ